MKQSFLEDKYYELDNMTETNNIKYESNTPQQQIFESYNTNPRNEIDNIEPYSLPFNNYETIDNFTEELTEPPKQLSIRSTNSIKSVNQIEQTNSIRPSNPIRSANSARPVDSTKLSKTIRSSNTVRSMPKISIMPLKKIKLSDSKRRRSGSISMLIDMTPYINRYRQCDSTIVHNNVSSGSNDDIVLQICEYGFYLLLALVLVCMFNRR